MSKKIFALVMVISVLGAFLAGCGKKEDEAGATAGAATAGTATAGTATAATAGGDTKTP